MHFLDTQVLSYAFNGEFDERINGNAISSIAASEFLLQHDKNLTQANYYIPSKVFMRPLTYHYYSRVARGGTAIRNRINRRITDKVTIEFGTEHETITHFSNNSLAFVINTKKCDVFFDSISVVEKNKQKLIKSKFEFLLENKIVCKPIGETTVQTGYRLLDEFLKEYNIKTNFRNSWNDILIFASALQASKPLITYDSVLSKFIGKRYAMSSSQIEPHFSILDFAQDKKGDKKIRSESKGYINRGWRVIFKK